LAEEVRVFPLHDIPQWQMNSVMSLQITAPGGDALPVEYSVYPLTASLGLNQSATSRGAVQFEGQLIPADSPGIVNQTLTGKVVYLCCDPTNATTVMNELIANESNWPKAILLYSIENTNMCCSISLDPPFHTIFTMSSAEEAADTLNFTLISARSEGVDSPVIATISGNVTTDQQNEQDGRNGSNSAVAMSILYSITGLITLLFLIIIATGAFRAHRYPERYGPRSGYGGRPRQSRAKGLARAVLETLPIVKFGDPSPAKPDPVLELEHQPSRSSHDPATGTRLSAIPEEPQSAKFKPQSESVPEADADHIEASSSAAEGSSSNSSTGAAGKAVATDAGDNHQESDSEHLGCSICTEDFTVGEDVRVLPCNHKFHPPCIDPWLVNVSGTCPLCRLDLRPQDEKENATDDPANPTNAEASTQLAPPLAADESEQQQQHDENGASSTQRRRSSRLLDLHRLRHASIEERIEILRRHRSQQQESAAAAAATATAATSQTGEGAGAGAADPEERGRRAKLTARLRDKFRIRTRTQSPPAAAPTSVPAPASAPAQEVG
ncbi:hypothetical protein B0T17DRAFT_474368, partial [Bombardia bombarda]